MTGEAGVSRGNAILSQPALSEAEGKGGAIVIPSVSEGSDWSMRDDFSLILHLLPLGEGMSLAPSS